MIIFVDSWYGGGSLHFCKVCIFFMLNFLSPAELSFQLNDIKVHGAMA